MMGKGRLPHDGKVGQYVSFTNPKIRKKEWGKVEEEIWQPEPRGFGETCGADNDWGEYAFVAQRIRWDEDHSETIRVTYYRRAPGGGESDWVFAGQYAPNTDADTWTCLVQKMVDRGWIKLRASN